MSRNGKRQQTKTAVIMILRERTIALPGKRIYWYFRWLKLGISEATLWHVLEDMENDGLVEKFDEGRSHYYRLTQKGWEYDD